LNFPSLLVVLWIFRRAEKGTDRDRPEIVSTNAKSKAVLDCAKQLADEGREDQHAVAELRASASNRRRTLRQAERASRFMGSHHELSRANLANRLLKAALAREAVPSPPTVRDKARIEAVENFNRLARDQQWALLTQLQPALVELESDVRAGRFGEITTRDGRQEVMTQLRPLVGPSSGHDNQLLETQRALDIANAYLLRPPS